MQPFMKNGRVADTCNDMPIFHKFAIKDICL